MKRPRYNYDVASGLSQLTRKLPEQLYTYAKIDEKSESDLLSFIYRFSSIVEYYNLNNKKEGDWQYFFSSNPHILLSILEDINVYSFNFTFDKLSDFIRANNTVAEKVEALEKTFVFLYQLILEMHATFEKISKLVNALSTVSDVSWQDSDIFYLYNQLFNWREDVQKIEGVVFSTNEWPILDVPLNDNFSITHLDFEPEDAIQDKIISTVSTLGVFFGDVQGKYAYYLSNGKYLLKQAIQGKEVYYEPHLGVVKSFLDIYTHLQEKINLIPKRHIDFYYQQILGQSLTPQKIDTVHLALTLGNSIDNYLLKKDTVFIAQLPELNDPIHYKAVRDSVINKSSIAYLHNILVSEHQSSLIKDDVSNTKEKTVFQNSLDIKKNQVKDDINKKGFTIFGQDPFYESTVESEMENAKIGFMAGSEILFQTAGKRIFSLDFYLDEYSFNLLKKYVNSYSKEIGSNEKVLPIELLKSAFKISITVEEGWYELDYYSVKFDVDNIEDKVISYNFQLKEDEPDIGIYKTEIHGGDYPSSIPLVHFEVNPNSFHNSYSFLKGLVIDRIGFNMTVSGNSKLVLSNNLGLINADNPFTPFGPQPSENAYLDIQNENVFNKFTTDFSIQIDWFNLPTNENGFAEYFKEYGQDVDNDSFTLGISSMDINNFKPGLEEQQQFKVFGSLRKNDKVGILNPVTKINQIDFGKLKFSNPMSLEKESEDIFLNTQKGIVRLQLLGPIDPFGHKRYGKIFSDTSIHNSRKFGFKKPMPKEPFTPLIKSINVSYTLTSTEIFNRGIIDEKFESDLLFIHVHPFGYDLLYPNPKFPVFKIIPEFSFERQSYFGIENISPSEELTLYFELTDLHPTHTVIKKPIVTWSYLVDNNWYPLADTQILDDTTDGFLKSGIVTIQLPSDITTNNTILPAGIYWLSAQFNGNVNYNMKLLHLYTNTIELERVDNGVPFDLSSLPAGTIKQSEFPIPELDTVFQPFSSFGGVIGENYEQFNTRVSELLRTKNRFITTRDLTQAILNRFPSLIYVQCMANGLQTDLLLEDMDLLITVVPVLNEISNYDEEKLPYVDYEELTVISSFIKNILPPSIKFVVTNPIYEFIKVKCNVLFAYSRINQNLNTNIARLNDDIINFISPWLRNSNVANFKDSRVIYLNDLINFIKRRPYIKYVSGVSLLHFYKKMDTVTHELVNVLADSTTQSEEIIKASLPGAILAPMSEHFIQLLQSEVFVPSSKAGISNFKLGKELILAEEVNQINVDKVVINQSKLPNFTITLKL